MTDVEKYGLFAVVFVGGLLLVIATQGGFGEGEAVATAPELIDSATPLRSPAPAPGPAQDASKVKVVSVLPSAPFRWEEPPVSYPGPRSIRAPEAPAAATSRTADPLAAPGTHVVARGETLSDIARLHLGSAQRWRELIALNPGVDPKKLQLGQVLRVAGPPPAAAAAPPSTEKPAADVGKPSAGPTAVPAAATAGGARTHTIAKGDTLGEIAQRYLGSAQKADAIYRANTDVLKSKDDLRIGQVLRIP